MAEKVSSIRYAVLESIKFNKKWIALTIINCFLLSSLLVFGGENYSIDSYGIYVRGIATEWKWHFGQFGFLSGLIDLFFGLIGHNPIQNATIDIIIFVAVLSICSSAFAKKVTERFNFKSIITAFIIDLCYIITFANIWCCDTLSFPECVMASAISIIPFTVLVVYFLNLKTIKDYIICGILLLITLLCSKTSLALFVIYAIAIVGVRTIVNNEKSIKSIILLYIKPALMVICSTIIFFVLAIGINKVCNVTLNARVQVGTNVLFKQLYFYLSHAHSYIKGRGFFSSELLTVCYLLIGILWLCVILRCCIKQKNAILGISLIIVCAVAYFAAHATVLFAESKSYRGLSPLFSLFFLFALGILAASSAKPVRLVLACIMCVLVVSNIAVSVNREINQKIVNKCDNIYAISVRDAIEEYENMNDCKIDNIAVCNDLHKDYGGVTTDVDYAFGNIMEIVSGNSYSIIDMPDEIAESFTGKDWTSWNPAEQMIFDKDTVYLCVY